LNFFSNTNDITEPVTAAVMMIGNFRLAISAEYGSETWIGKSKINFLFESLESPTAGLSRMSILRRYLPELLKL
jgi:hypothetical protein